MFLESIVICIDIPESFYIFGDCRINPIVICQNAICVISQLLKNIADPIHMCLEILVIHSVQINFNICSDRFYRLLDILKIIVQIFPACFA